MTSEAVGVRGAGAVAQLVHPVQLCVGLHAALFWRPHDHDGMLCALAAAEPAVFVAVSGAVHGSCDCCRAERFS